MSPQQTADLHYETAVLRRLCGNMSGASRAYRQAIALGVSRLPEAYHGLGIALLELGELRDALACCLKAVELRPEFAAAYIDLGRTAAKLGHPRTAVLALRKALGFDPGQYKAHLELGRALYSLGLLEEASASFARAIELSEQTSGGSGIGAARHHLAMVRTLMGDRAGLSMLEELVLEQPLSALAHFQWAIGLLLHGEYRRGWEQYEWRMQVESMRPHHPSFDQPRWQGEPLHGRSILLYSEQGFGDTLQFARYAPLVAARGGRVLLEVERPLERLLRGLPGVAACTVRGEPRPEFAVYAPLMSLALLFETSLETIPPPVAPTVPPMRVTPPPHRPGYQVGIAWGGSPRHDRDRLRSSSLADWKPLLALEGVAWTSLQKGPAMLQVREHGSAFGFVEDRGPMWDFADTASVMSGMDLVITVDTSVAHLAGTLGKPVWILLANLLDWRWGLAGGESPWYPSARLFRQTTPGDWTQVMAEVADALRALVEPRQATPTSNRTA